MKGYFDKYLKRKGWKMLKKVFSSVVLLAAMNASAGENYFANEWDAKGLIAIEAAGGSMNLKDQSPTVVAAEEDVADASVALKLGGESKYYRLFVEGRYYMVDQGSFESIEAASLGLQIDYLIRAGEHFNIFMGLNGGGIYSQFQDTATPSLQQTNKDAYAGAQAGVNIDIINNLGIELGERAKYVFSEDNVYSISNMYEGYAAIVFKFTGEY